MITRPRCAICGDVWGKVLRGPEIHSAAWPKAHGWEQLGGDQWDCHKHGEQYNDEWARVERARLPS